MRNLKKGSMVRYTGKTTGFFTYNKIYKVVEEAYEQYFSKTYAIKIKDNKSYKSIKKLIVIAVILIVGLSGLTITLGSIAISGLALAVIVGVILNLVLNHKDI